MDGSGSSHLVPDGGNLLNPSDGLRSLLVVTLDSCRYDTAVQQPNLLGVGERLIRARSHGTFTLPAHTALFFGYAPVPMGTSQRCDVGLFGKVQPTRGHTLWSGQPGPVHGGNWLDDLRQLGVRTVGAGGVRWFLHDGLRDGFDSFHYWGPPFRPEDQDLPEAEPDHFALHHTNELVRAVQGGSPWLLFVNAAETHAPYLAEPDLLPAQRQLSFLRNGKGDLPDDAETRTLMSMLWRAQQRALAVAGRRLRRLCAALPRPFDYLICADHGESFGENRRWGHVHGAPEVWEVPMWIGSCG